MKWNASRFRIPLVLILTFLHSVVFAQDAPYHLAPRLPNGLTLDPAGRSFNVGNMPLSGVLSPDGKIVMLLSGFLQQGVQVLDPVSGNVVQTTAQPSAFVGLAFSSDGRTLYASGAGEDVVYQYDWTNGTAALKGKLALAPPRKEEDPPHSYPAGIALSKNNRYLYVAENLADSLAVIDLKTGQVIDRKPAGRYPYAVVVAGNGSVYVSAWGESDVTFFNTKSSGAKLANPRKIVVGRHPSALLLNAKGNRLFAASASTDSIAVVDTKAFKVIATLNDSAPGVHEGSTPNALALSGDEKRLYVAEADNNSVAVFQLSSKSSGISHGAVEDSLLGRIPVGWYPTALLSQHDRLYVINGKGKGTKANPTATQGAVYIKTPTEYTLGQLNGTVTLLELSDLTEKQLETGSNHVAELNHWQSSQKAVYPPFKHVLYIIKENRTYDQIFGDVPEGDGDPSLVYFPQSVSPNHRALAERFGLYDRFFVNAEVSSQGHPWSTSAYVTDFREKTVHSTYSDRRVEEAPDDDASDPAAGYFWDLAPRNHVSLRIYGEYGELAPDQKTYRSAKPAARAYTSPTYPCYDLKIQDQARVDAWVAEFNEFVKQGEMPSLQIFHLPNDHTAGARAGMATPLAYFADNDLALGRLVETLSGSPFWKDTVVFVLEDDAQSGPDHVDSHRSALLVISAYNKPGAVHRFVNTTDVIATIEEILGLDSFSQFDHYGTSLQDQFSETPNLDSYHAITPEQSLTEANPEGPSAQKSLDLKLDKPDQSDDDEFNRILWVAIKGDSIPFPAERRVSLLQIQQGK